ncbi:MAG TPA: hypothetical protein DCS97_00440 [Planctomycetes bacterium]|nr:hypothetical protein [Planctomycetota bacterium]
MKSSLVCLGLSCLALSPLSAADFYVAPGGSDGNIGTQVSPWATIGKAMGSSASNDRIYLARGGTWRETFTIGGNRQLLAYGSGADPVITGSRAVTMTGTWGSNSNVRTGSVSAEALSLWVNGSFQPLARYPNSGYLNTASGTTLNSITGSALPSRSTGRWSGAQVRWHRWHWFWETRPITTDGGGATLTLSTSAVTPSGTTTPSETGLIGIPSGFYIDKDLDELDAPGEWFSSTSQVYVYPPTGIDGGTMTVEVATNATPISVTGATIRGIAFRRFHGSALQIGNPSTIEDCTFEQIGDTAITTTYNSGGTQIRRNLIRDVLNCGIVTTHNPSSASTVIERNLLHRIGMVRGYGGSGTWKQVGILSNVGTSTITLNRIVDTGYAGILLGNTAGNTATRNLIVRSMSTSNDGAGIYTYKGPNTMNENIVLDSRGSQVAAEPFYPTGHGIWPEFLDGIADSQINDNTIAGCNGSGIVLDNNFTCQVDRNTLFDNLSAGLTLDIQGTNYSNQGHTLDGNTFVTLETSRRLPTEGNFDTGHWTLSEPSTGIWFYRTNPVDYGLLRNSTFVVGAGTTLARGSEWNDPTYTSLTALATAQPSWVENSGVTRNQNAVLLINDTEVPADLAVPAGTWTRTDGSAVGATVNLAAFRSVVLIGNGSAPASPIYQTVSGIDWRLTTPTEVYLTSQQEIAVSRTGTVITDGGSNSVSGTVATQATALQFTISNLGTASLNLTLPVAVGAQSNCTATITTAPNALITAGSTTTLQVSVTPTTAAAWSFTLSVANDDADENPFNWTVSGTATPVPQPEIAVSRGASTIADGGTDAVGGTTSLVAENLTYTIANTGTASLTLGAASFGGLTNCSATIPTQPAATVAAGGSTTLVVRITPSGTAPWSCLISFTTNDTDENPTNWTAQGTAVLAAPEIALSRGASAIADGASDTLSATVAGSPSSLAYTVANTGSASLTISPPTLSGLVNCTASVTSNPVSPVAAFSGSTTFTIQVTPTSAAAWSLNASLVNNDANENPTDWTIQGTAAASGGGGTTPSASAGGGGCGAGMAGILVLLGCGLGLRRRRR